LRRTRRLASQNAPGHKAGREMATAINRIFIQLASKAQSSIIIYGSNPKINDPLSEK
jgi:hypothetical protein